MKCTFGGHPGPQLRAHLLLQGVGERPKTPSYVAPATGDVMEKLWCELSAFSSDLRLLSHIFGIRWDTNVGQARALILHGQLFRA
jgi:hypothetical protein